MADLKFFYLPVGGPITGRFAETGGGYPADGHKGLDLASPVGTDVLNPYPGIVKAVHRVDSNNKPLDGWGDGSLGNCVVLDYVDTPWFAFFAHLSAVGDFREGDSLTRGHVLGKVGVTGKTSGPHLHFALCKNTGHFGTIDQFADPLSFLVTAGESNVSTLEERVALLEKLVVSNGLIGPTNKGRVPDLFGEAALQYAAKQGYSALLGVQLSGLRDGDLAQMIMSISTKKELIELLKDWIEELEDGVH